MVQINCHKKISGFSGKSNNLNLLKFLASILVIFSHAFVITGTPDEPLSTLTNNQLSFGGFAVAIFFFASGFFVTKSLLKKQSGRIYFKSRIAKIYPAFLVVLLITVFLLGPIVSEYAPGRYFTDPNTYTYFSYLLMIPNYDLPGVFLNNPYKIVVNGSLWTLILEIICYICLFIAWRLKFLEKRALKRLNYIFIPVLIIVFIIRPDQIYQYHTYLRPMFIFIMGMEYYIFRDSISLSFKPVILMTAVGAAMLFFGLIDFFMICVFPYLLCLLIFTPKQVNEKIGRLGEYSYAIYLIAFPIQQTLIHYFPDTGVFFNTFITLLFSFILSISIYHWIEKPCFDKIMAFKKA